MSSYLARLEDAIDALDFELDDDEGLTDLQQSMDEIASVWAESKKFDALEDASSERLDVLLEYVGERALSEKATELYEFSLGSNYDGIPRSEHVKEARKLTRELYKGVRKAVGLAQRKKVVSKRKR